MSRLPAGAVRQPLRRRAHQQQAIGERLSYLRHSTRERAQQQDDDAELGDELRG
jgi:hypothetical protein